MLININNCWVLRTSDFAKSVCVHYSNPVHFLFSDEEAKVEVKYLGAHGW
jgi:hypothetical protein